MQLQHAILIPLLTFAFIAFPCDEHDHTATESSSRTILSGNARDGYTLLYNSEPYSIKGVGGDKHLDLLARLGGNTIRTWGVGPETEKLLDKAHQNGIAVTLGIWLQHERHGFNYRNKDKLEEQRQIVLAAVERFKNHPALLCWGLGNEMEGVTGEGADSAIWKEVNYLAEQIKNLDPYHPIISVVANVNPAKIKAIKRYAPEIDILGINAYAGASGLADKLRQYSWDKPYLLTEFGPPGPWEVAHTDWNAPIEPSSFEKMSHYYASHQDVIEDEKQCLGSFAFLWGNKQEATASWFGMLLEDGCKLPVADTMSYLWKQKWPENRSPLLKEADIPFANLKVKATQTFTVRAAYSDPDEDSLDYQWSVFAESSDRRIGGDKEQVPDEFKSSIISVKSRGRATIQMPEKEGAYRLYVTVRDGKGGAAIDNWPFYVK